MSLFPVCSQAVVNPLVRLLIPARMAMVTGKVSPETRQPRACARTSQSRCAASAPAPAQQHRRPGADRCVPGAYRPGAYHGPASAEACQALFQVLLRASQPGDHTTPRARACAYLSLQPTPLAQPQRSARARAYIPLGVAQLVNLARACLSWPCGPRGTSISPRPG